MKTQEKTQEPQEYYKEEVFSDDRSSQASIDSCKIIKTHPTKEAYDNIDELHNSQKQTTPFVKTAAEKKLVQKINLALLPFVGAISFIQFVDKVQLGLTAIFGIIEDTHLTGIQYSWLSSIFFIGYICFQLPNNYIIPKVPISKYLGMLTILWGIAMACTALCKNFAQLAVVRFFLGVFEASAYPCLLITVNAIYRRCEQSAAYGFMYASLGVGSMLSAVCTYGISYINNAQGIHTWRWPYIIWGSLTIVVGIATLLFMPDNPYSPMFRLTEEEKLIVDERIKDNAVVRVRNVKKHHILEALKEPRLWLVSCSGLFFSMQAQGVTAFGSIIVSNLGFSVHETMLFGIATAGISVTSCVVVVFIMRKSGQMYFATVVVCTLTLVGFVLLAVLPNTGIKLIGYLMSMVSGGLFIVLSAIISNNVAGYTKKVFYNAMLMIFNTIGSIIGPFVMLQREAPFYKTGMIIFCTAIALILVMLLTVRQIMAKENKVRLQNHMKEEVDVKADLTDRENRTIIYKL